MNPAVEMVAMLARDGVPADRFAEYLQLLAEAADSNGGGDARVEKLAAAMERRRVKDAERKRTFRRLSAVKSAETSADALVAVTPENAGDCEERPRTLETASRAPAHVEEKPLTLEIEPQKEGKKERVSRASGGGAVEGSPSAPSPKGTRLDPDAVLIKSWGDWALAEFPHLTEERVRSIWATFKDYWIAQAGAKGRKADWLATWRNWVRREAERVNGNGRERSATGYYPGSHDDRKARNMQSHLRAYGLVDDVPNGGGSGGPTIDGHARHFPSSD